MFDRKESLVKAIKDKTIDRSSLKLMIDFYVLKEKLTEGDQEELLTLLEPPAAEPEQTAGGGDRT